MIMTMTMTIIVQDFLQSTGQMMSSVRLYFLPEYTLEGRQPHHGEVSTQIQIQIQIQMQKLKQKQIQMQKQKQKQLC